MDTPNTMQLCRICISSNSNCTQMISIFGEDSLWKKITTLADVKIEKGDTLPQQVCVACAKTAISACLFKKKCEDADNFFRQQLLIQKIESKTAFSNQHNINDSISEISDGESQEHQHCAAILRIEHHQSQHDVSIGVDLGNTNNHSSGNEDGHATDRSTVIGCIAGTEIAEDGEIKSINDKPVAFDIHSIRMMHEYMQQQLNKINGAHHSNELNGAASGSEVAEDDDEQLPLIPEIELITPSDELSAMQPGGQNMSGGNIGLHTRGYQCPSCYQIFEMKQILKAHMQSVHGSAGPVYECSNCKKTYFYKRFLEKHVRRGRCVKKRRNQTRPMQCSDCHVLFPTGHHLGWHKRTGCPSRAAKMPLQQLFKQNIVQYNNFPKRIGIRKPENAIYLHNRKIIMANKRKGRTRIKLDAKKIALAKQLILREATTTVIANELNISRTFAWRLRKSLVNGVSLHERVIDPNAEEIVAAIPDLGFTETIVKHEGTENVNHNDNDGLDSVSEGGQNEDNYNEISGNKIERCDEDDDDDDYGNNNDNDNGSKEVANPIQPDGIEQQYSLDETMQFQKKLAQDTENNEADNETMKYDGLNDHSQLMQHQQHQQFLKDIAACAQRQDGDEMIKEMMFHGDAHNLNEPGMAMVNPPVFPPAIAAAINQLPVNLSIRPVARMQNSDIPNKAQTKKPRKPNVFIDDEKYAMAKLLVAQNASTMEIARALNVSQMTAWKVRDAIVKGVPLSYRTKRDVRNNTSSDNRLEETMQKPLQTPKLHQEQMLQQQRQRQQLQKQQLELFKHQPIQQLQISQPVVPPQHIQPGQSLELLQHQQAQQATSSSSVKPITPRRRLKAAEREMRDKEITREILELIKEDSNIQYWKVSARLAEKGFPISPSSVCQKLKAMGIHRRWKPGDKPPMLNMEQLKVGSVIGSGANSSSTEEEGYEPQFDMGGAHFLSAFTH